MPGLIQIWRRRRSSILCLALLTGAALSASDALAQSQHAYPRLVIDKFRTVDLTLDPLSDEANQLGISSHGVRTLAHMRMRMAGIDITERKDSASIYLNVDVKGPAYHVRISMLRPVSYLVHGEARKTLAETWYDETMGIHDGDRKSLDAGIVKMLDRFVEEYIRINNEYRPRR